MTFDLNGNPMSSSKGPNFIGTTTGSTVTQTGGPGLGGSSSSSGGGSSSSSSGYSTYGSSTVTAAPEANFAAVGTTSDSDPIKLNATGSGTVAGSKSLKLNLKNCNGNSKKKPKLDAVSNQMNVMGSGLEEGRYASPGPVGGVVSQAAKNTSVSAKAAANTSGGRKK